MYGHCHGAFKVNEDYTVVVKVDVYGPDEQRATHMAEWVAGNLEKHVPQHPGQLSGVGLIPDVSGTDVPANAIRTAQAMPFVNEKGCGLIIHWSELGTGFGELTIYCDKETGEWSVDTETMGPDWVGRMLLSLVGTVVVKDEYGNSEESGGTNG